MKLRDLHEARVPSLKDFDINVAEGRSFFKSKGRGVGREVWLKTVKITPVNWPGSTEQGLLLQTLESISMRACYFDQDVHPDLTPFFDRIDHVAANKDFSQLTIALDEDDPLTLPQVRAFFDVFLGLYASRKVR